MIRGRQAYFLAAAILAALCLSGISHAEPVQASEGQITLPTYTWYDDANPVFDALESGIYYPYTRQDLLGIEKIDRTYRAVFLENEYLKVTCLPELGGRIHSVLDKTTNEEMYHKNDVIKPALIAMRGAWISGGIEWNPGPHGHTVTIVSPVDVTTVKNPDGSAALAIANVEKMFRTRWTVRLTLHPGKAYLDEEIAIYNPNDAINPYYFWNCTAFPNLPGTRFIYPMTLGCDHAGTSFFTWPMHEGKDITWLKNYQTMASVFAFECGFDFFGAYDVDRNRGIVSFADHDKLPGKKAWTWGKDDFGVTSEMKLSDAGPVHSQYIEVQSGPLLTQADYGMLKPGDSVLWREYWYPVHGLGDGFEYATREACVNVKYTGLAIDVNVLATGVYPGARVTVASANEKLADQQVDLSPQLPALVAVQDAPGGPITITVTAADGQELLRYVSPLQIPKVEPPDLTKKPAQPDGLPTPDELYAEASLLDSQTNPVGAYAAYEKVIEADPGHVPALCGLAVIEIEQAQYEKAEAHACKAIERDREHGWPWYLLAMTHLRRARYDDALYAANKAMLSKDAQALGYGVAGRAYAALGKYEEAETMLARAVKIKPDARSRARVLAVQAAMGGNAAELASAEVEQDPVDWIFRAIADSRGNEKYQWAARNLLTASGEPEFNALNVASFFADLGLYEEAARWLMAYTDQASATAGSPSLYSSYALAYYADKAGGKKAGADFLQQAQGVSPDFAFPHGADALDVMLYAAAANPNDASAHLLLGYVYAGLNRLEEAVPEWRKSVELNPRLSTALRLLGLYEWKVAKRLDEAEKWYRKAIEARPDDQILHRDLCEILGASGRRAEAIQIAQAAPRSPAPRYDLILWLADAYVAEARYDDCINLLSTERFSNWEGSSKPRDVLVSALMARGKARFDAGQTESALADFQAALEYPENLGVGARYARTDAEVQYWLGKALMTLGRRDDARAAWENGAGQHTSKSKPLPMISVPAGQDDFVQRCQTALELLNVGAVVSPAPSRPQALGSGHDGGEPQAAGSRTLITRNDRVAAGACHE
ncbi:MAG: DUF5107 domain-containing protein [Candidatus Hydrogenedentes bacterium]|nr:DUF5107 domain-containing protein [Candidatus Hydrogenedentota bacterium]